jgi:hypothetical protein
VKKKRCQSFFYGVECTGSRGEPKGTALGFGMGVTKVVFGALLGEEAKNRFSDPIFFPGGPNEARLALPLAGFP